MIEIEIVKFSRPGCVPCKIIANYLSEIDFAKHNATLTEIDISEQPGAVDEYGLSSVPVLVYKRNGMEVARLNGLRPVEEIVETIELAREVR